MISLTELKNYIHFVDILVEDSRLHKDFEEYLVLKDVWVKAKVIGSNIAIDVSFEQFIQVKCEDLRTKLQGISKNI